MYVHKYNDAAFILKNLSMSNTHLSLNNVSSYIIVLVSYVHTYMHSCTFALQYEYMHTYMSCIFKYTHVYICYIYLHI